MKGEGMDMVKDEKVLSSAQQAAPSGTSPTGKKTVPSSPHPPPPPNPPPAAAAAAVEDDGIDMFSDSPVATVAAGKSRGAAVEELEDERDDHEGYYLARVGESLGGRYTVRGELGKGVFSSVVLARDGGDGGPEVAIKVVRQNETMLTAGQKEKGLLELLARKDPEDKWHVIRLLSSFTHRGHLCLVFEPMAMNLRSVLKKHGHHVGLHPSAIRHYAIQLLLALSHLDACRVLHADLKLDNVLCDASCKRIKLADLGSASSVEENEITPYLVSRFYRAPEIILGMEYGPPIDMWSLGCCLYELYTGRILFPGKTNNDMLRLFQEVQGPFARKTLRRGAFREQHFNDEFVFLHRTVDPYSRQDVVRAVNYVKPTNSLADLLTPKGSKLPADTAVQVAQLRDLLRKMLALDPQLRITPKDALKHPFVRSSTAP